MTKPTNDPQLELIREMQRMIENLRRDVTDAHRKREETVRDARSLETALAALLDGYQRANIAGHLAVPGLAEAALDANRVLWRITSKREPPRVLPPDPDPDAPRIEVETELGRRASLGERVPNLERAMLTLDARVAELEETLAQVDARVPDAARDRMAELERTLVLVETRAERRLNAHHQRIVTLEEAATIAGWPEGTVISRTDPPDPPLPPSPPSDTERTIEIG